MLSIQLLSIAVHADRLLYFLHSSPFLKKGLSPKCVISFPISPCISSSFWYVFCIMEKVTWSFILSMTSSDRSFPTCFAILQMDPFRSWNWRQNKNPHRKMILSYLKMKMVHFYQWMRSWWWSCGLKVMTLLVTVDGEIKSQVENMLLEMAGNWWIWLSIDEEIG